jgi:CRP/FNR family cyclic AMP-dependent transcriptional regulator
VTAPFDLFQWLPTKVRGAFAPYAHVRRYTAGQVIYCQDEPSDEIYRISSGSVRLSLIRFDGREFLQGIFGAGDFFGEGSLLDGLPRPNTAQAQQDVEIEAYDRAGISALRETHREIDAAFVQMLARRMRILCHVCAMSNVDDLSHRVAMQLLMGPDLGGLSTQSEAPDTLSLSHADLALMLGAARQSVSKVLHNMQRLGAVDLGYGGIHIRDRTKLKQIISSLQ